MATMKTEQSLDVASTAQTSSAYGRFPFYVLFLLIVGMTIGFATTYFGGVSAGSVKAGVLNPGDTAWVLAATALVLLMTPAVGFFYGGLVTSRNVVGVLKQTLLILALVSIQWVLFGYSLAFGKDFLGIIGGLDFFGLRGVGFAPGPYAPTIPHLAFMIFQGVGAIITPALILGSIVERVRFRTLVVFVLLWTTLVYDPLAHWVWGNGGWLQRMGVLDFAGGAVVHTSAGFAGLAAALVIGKRQDFQKGQGIASHHVPFILLGAGLLWFGWVGFNGGSALAADQHAVNAFVVTNTAGAAGALVWMILSWAEKKKPSAIATATGAVCGLIAITPASGYVGPIASLAIGILAGLVTYLALYLRSQRTKIDDTLDVWAAHGMGGVTGLLLTGLFAEKAINNAGNNGMLSGNASQLGIQLLAVLVTLSFSFVMTVLLLKVLSPLGLRVSAQEEDQGLDLAVHGEEAYALATALGEAEKRLDQLEVETAELRQTLRPASNESQGQQQPAHAPAPGNLPYAGALLDSPVGSFTSTGLQDQQQPAHAPALPSNLPHAGTLLDPPTSSFTSSYPNAGSPLDNLQFKRSRLGAAHVKLRPLQMGSGYENSSLLSCGHARPAEGKFCPVCGIPIAPYEHSKATNSLFSSAN